MSERFHEPSHTEPEGGSELERLKEQDRFERTAKAFLESVESGKLNLANPAAARYRDLLQRLKTRLAEPSLVMDEEVRSLSSRVAKIEYNLERRKACLAEEARERAEAEAFAQMEDPLKSLKDRLRRK